MPVIVNSTAVGAAICDCEVFFTAATADLSILTSPEFLIRMLCLKLKLSFENFDLEVILLTIKR